jgi:membrane protein YdbS with pleckstrin-like domain
MKKTNTNVKSSGVSFAGLLFLLFLGLKLTNQIDWSWWWVTAPLWGGIAIVLLITVFAMLLVIIITFFRYIFGIPLKNKISNNFKRK